jgi:outer membrane protein assembly factor BamD (BamD/ComL family)
MRNEYIITSDTFATYPRMDYQTAIRAAKDFIKDHGEDCHVINAHTGELVKTFKA